MVYHNRMLEEVKSMKGLWEVGLSETSAGKPARAFMTVGLCVYVSIFRFPIFYMQDSDIIIHIVSLQDVHSWTF